MSDLTAEQYSASAAALLRVIRDITVENPDHPRLGKRLAEAEETYGRLAARIAQHDAATSRHERISQLMYMETLVGTLERSCREAAMSASNPTGDPGRFITGDQADEEIARRLAQL